MNAVSYGLKFSSLLIVFGLRLEFSSFRNLRLMGLRPTGPAEVRLDRIPEHIKIGKDATEICFMGFHKSSFNLSVEGQQIGVLHKVGANYLGAGPLVGYMRFKEGGSLTLLEQLPKQSEANLNVFMIVTYGLYLVVVASYYIVGDYVTDQLEAQLHDEGTTIANLVKKDMDTTFTEEDGAPPADAIVSVSTYYDVSYDNTRQTRTVSVKKTYHTKDGETTTLYRAKELKMERKPFAKGSSAK